MATWGTGISHFNPYGVALDNWGNVYVTDNGDMTRVNTASYIHRLNSGGALTGTWAGYSPGNGQFFESGGLAIKGGNLYMVDSNCRVLVFGLPPNSASVLTGALLNLLLE